MPGPAPLRTDFTQRRGPGLRLRITLLATALVAFVSCLLLLLGWMLVGRVVDSMPAFPEGSTVRVDGVEVDTDVLSQVLGANARADVIRSGAVAFFFVVLAAAVLAWAITGRVLKPVHDVTEAARLPWPTRSAWSFRPRSIALRIPASWVPPSCVGTVLQ